MIPDDLLNEYVARFVQAHEKQAEAAESIAKDVEMIRVAVEDSLKIGGAIWRIGVR